MDDFSEKFVLSILKDVANFCTENKDMEAAVEVYRLRAELQTRWLATKGSNSNVIPMPQQRKA